MLEDAYRSWKRSASAGIDGVTWAEYGEYPAARLTDLHDRVHGGRYRGLPSKRARTPKSDGPKRPLGIAVLEDQIFQLAVSWVMQAIFMVTDDGRYSARGGDFTAAGEHLSASGDGCVDDMVAKPERPGRDEHRY